MSEAPKKTPEQEKAESEQELVTGILLFVFMILWIAAGPPRMP